MPQGVRIQAPALQQMPKECFLGVHVKLRFPVTNNPEVVGEHMWVRVDAVTVFGLSGTLANTPEFALEFAFGDRVDFIVTAIEACEFAA